MIEILKKEIEDSYAKLKEPNRTIDSYRCYYEGRIALAKELLQMYKKVKKGK